MRHQYPRFLILMHKILTSSPRKCRVTKRKKIPNIHIQKEKGFPHRQIMYNHNSPPKRQIPLGTCDTQGEWRATRSSSSVAALSSHRFSHCHCPCPQPPSLWQSSEKSSITSSTFSLGTEDKTCWCVAEDHRVCPAWGGCWLLAFSFLCATQGWALPSEGGGWHEAAKSWSPGACWRRSWLPAGSWGWASAALGRNQYKDCFEVQEEGQKRD